MSSLSRFFSPAMRYLTSLALVILCLFATSCSSGHFEKQWLAAKAKPIAKNSIEGPWQGTWRSDGNGHTGALRCIVGPAVDAAGTRAFQYRATWAHLLSGGFTSKAVVQQHGNTATFKAKQKLGKYGTFECDAVVKGDSFRSIYKAAGDHGVLEMSRPH